MANSHFPSGGGSGTPGGSDTQVQFNNAGAFGGFGSWDGTTLRAGSLAAGSKVGNPSAAFPASLQTTANDYHTGGNFELWRASSSYGPFIDMFGSAGTLASPEPQAPGDYLANFDFYSYNGHQWQYGAQITIGVESGSTGDDNSPVPSAYYFAWSTPTGNLSEVVQFRSTLNSHPTITLGGYPEFLNFEKTSGTGLKLSSGYDGTGTLDLLTTGSVQASGGYKSSDGSTGATGSANNTNTLTIKNGLVVAIT